MGIQALPQTTVRALGSTQVLTDPAAVVKELVDNALDANATNITIEIHSNTLDVIQVRDNGHGIAPEDRPLVARRYCTSKITHDDDLQNIGGTSLGFRGEALACAAELSGSLTISTRVEGEQTAVSLNISQHGEIESSGKSSLAVGTTVRITDFSKTNPVRRQMVLKNTEACLKTIKENLQAYALARPHVRLSVRVLKTKNTKMNWVYAPNPNRNAEDAAFKVVGKDCASQCTWSVVESAGFTLHCFLPRPDADPGKFANFGAFFSVDRRPVSTARGTFKQIRKRFDEALRRVNPEFEKVKAPFIVLQLSCSNASYDANVEPAKDDVLFEDSTAVLNVAQELFAAVYVPTRAELSNMQQRHNIASNALTDFDTLLEDTDVASPTDTRHSSRRKSFRTNMYGCDDADLPSIAEQLPSPSAIDADREELRQAEKDITLSNPWVLAKLNAPLTRPMDTDRLGQGLSSPFTEISSSSSVKHRFRPNIELSVLPTPRASSPPSPFKNFHPLDHVPPIHFARDGRVIGSDALPMPQPYTPMPSSDMERWSDGSLKAPPFRATSQYDCATSQYDCGLETMEPEHASGTPLSAIPDPSSRRQHSPKKPQQQGTLNRPFVPPAMKQMQRENVWFDHLQDIERSRAPRTQRRTQHNTSGLVVQGEVDSLSNDTRSLTPPRQTRDIRDFVGRSAESSITSLVERRNFDQPIPPCSGDVAGVEETDLAGDPPFDLAERRGFVPGSELLAPPKEGTDSHNKQSGKQRRTSERRALRELSTNAAEVRLDSKSPAVSHSNNEYFSETSRQSLQRKKSYNKLGRSKSSKLPLESVPRGQGTHDVVYHLSASMDSISGSMEKINKAASLLPYDSPALPRPTGMDEAATHWIALSGKLHRLLLMAGNETEKIEPHQLLREVKAALARQHGMSDRA